jgi:hypothetical protein
MAAPRNDLVLYLALTPEFGGTRFGPFEGLEARLGSDGNRCHITIPEAFGVATEHCKVLRQGPDNLLVAPADRTAAVWVWKGDARRPVQATSPTAVRPGDSFALVSPEGPRFVIELGPLPPEIQAERERAKRSKRGFRDLTAGGFATAGKDLILARLMTLSPLQMVMRGWHYIASGAIWNPRVLLLLAMASGGYVASAVAGFNACAARKEAAGFKKQADTCQESLAYAEGMGGNVDNFNFDQLASTITGVNALGLAMQKDPQFLELVKTEAKKIAANPEHYSWLYEKSARSEEFSKWRERVEKADGLDPDVRRMLPYLAATRNRVKGPWDRVVDSQEVEVCGRGPLRLTYRQARNLGLASVQLDAYVAGDATQVAQQEAERAALLQKTAQAALEVAPTELPPSLAEVVKQGQSTCVRADGDDDREDLQKLGSMLDDQLGKDAMFVPAAETGFGLVARVAKLYAADVPNLRWTDDKNAMLDFRRGTPTGAVADLVGKQWVLERTAEVFARALVLPCEGVLDGDRDRAEATFGTLPAAVPCLVLNYRLTHE